MRWFLCVLGVLCGACAAGPRPVPNGVSAKDRVTFSEGAVQGAKNATATFEIDSQGENPSHFTGALELVGGNVLKLTAEGNFRGEAVVLEVDSKDPAGVSRSMTKGPSVSSHRDPPATSLGEAVALGLVRMGLLHNLAVLSMDEPVDKAMGGFDDWVKTVEHKDGAADSVNGEACHRVSFGIMVDGKRRGDAALCISDATGLPVHRTQTVRFDSGEMRVSETFKWTMK